MTLCKFNIIVISTIKHIIVITVTPVHASIVKVNILLLPNPTVSAVYRCQQKRISFNKQINLEINKIFTTGCIGHVKWTLMIKLWSVLNIECIITSSLLVKMHKTHFSKLSKIGIDTKTIGGNFQKTITLTLWNIWTFFLLINCNTKNKHHP